MAKRVTKRVTIILDDDLVKKLHEKQSKLIKESKGAVSFSKVVNDTARKGLKKV